MVIRFFVLCVAGLLILSAPAWASSSKKTADSCRALGSLVIKCYYCSNTDKRLLGKAAVLSQYIEEHGGKFCVPAASGKRACAYTHNVPEKRVGFKAEFKIGSTTYTETFKTNCVNAVGD